MSKNTARTLQIIGIVLIAGFIAVEIRNFMPNMYMIQGNLEILFRKMLIGEIANCMTSPSFLVGIICFIVGTIKLQKYKQDAIIKKDAKPNKD